MINFTALIDHNLAGGQLHTLPDLLNAKWHEIRHLLPVFEGYPVEDGYWRWEPELLTPTAGDEDERFRLEGPNGFLGHVGKYAIGLHHLARWLSFVEDEKIRPRLRGICIHIAKVLKSNRIVYVPDSGSNLESGAYWMVSDSMNIGAITQWLTSHCGPPPVSIESIKSNPEYAISGAGYYIDKLQA